MGLERLMSELVALGQLGRPSNKKVAKYEDLSSEKGLWRMEGTAYCHQSRDYVVKRMKAAGLEVRFDPVGNIFAHKAGTKPEKNAVMLGSHIDSVKNGGQFDGPLGVMTALEAVRILNEEEFSNSRPIEIAVFAAEEGSAFKQALLGSDVVIGNKSAEAALRMKNEEGRTLAEALGNYCGDYMLDLEGLEYFIELHPEQGPILDREQIPIGIVENITGITWLHTQITGEENHAGTTPMHMRKDALVAAADLVTHIYQRAQAFANQQGSSTVATVGHLEVHPSAPNIVPGQVKVNIDVRDGINENIKKLRAEILNYIQELQDKFNVEIKTSTLFHKDPTPCSQEVVRAIELAAEDLRMPYKKMNSGAGHDAQNMAKKVKSSMIFVPSMNGISHSPLEWTEWAYVEKGLHVLTRTLKDLCQR